MRAKSLLLATVSIFPLVGFANAADLAVKAAPLPVPVVTWTGCYIGGSVGGVMHMAKTDISDLTMYEGYSSQTLDYTKSGMAYGGQIGCNYQHRNFVIGIEADYNWLNGDMSNTIQHVDSYETSSITNNLDSMYTVRARFGFDLDGTLVYGTLGAGQIKTDNNVYVNADSSGPKGGNFVSSGWKPVFVVGGGVEHMLTQSWTIKGEVLYGWSNTVSAGATDPHYFEDGNAVKYTSQLAVARIGINYLFHPF